VRSRPAAHLVGPKRARPSWADALRRRSAATQGGKTIWPRKLTPDPGQIPLPHYPFPQELGLDSVLAAERAELSTALNATGPASDWIAVKPSAAGKVVKGKAAAEQFLKAAEAAERGDEEEEDEDEEMDDEEEEDEEEDEEEEESDEDGMDEGEAQKALAGAGERGGQGAGAKATGGAIRSANSGAVSRAGGQAFDFSVLKGKAVQGGRKGGK